MFIDEIAKEQSKNYDRAIIKFLQDNGYTVPKIITNDYLQQLKSELESKNQFLDVLEYTESHVEDNIYYADQYLIPFFNNLSNPLTQEERDRIIQYFVKMKKGEDKDAEN